MHPFSLLAACAALCAPLILGGCAAETSQALAATRSPEGARSPLVVGAFDKLDLAIREAVDAGLLPALAPR